MLSDHFPVLLIILPLMAAPLCVIARRSISAWLIALLVSGVAVCLSIGILWQTLSGDVIHYALAGWVAPTGIECYIDTLNASLLLVISLVSLLTLIYSQPSIQNEIDISRHYLFYTAWLLCLTGLLNEAALRQNAQP